jgi:hypothetical protein
LISQLKDGKVKADIYIYPNQLIFNGYLIKVDENLYNFTGDLTHVEKSKDFHVESPIQIENGELSSIEINIIPKIISNLENQQENLHIKLKKVMNGLILEGKNQQINGKVEMNLINSFNWNFEVQCSEVNNRSYNFITYMNVKVNGNTSLFLQVQTPWKQIKNLKFDGNLLLNSEIGSARTQYQFNEDFGHVSFIWRLFYLSDMFANIAFIHHVNEVTVKDMNAMIFYLNPKKAFKNIDVGFNVNIDEDKWKFGSNASVGLLDQNNFDALLKVILPPNKNTHNLLLSYHTNNDYNDLSYVVGYSADLSKSNYASDGSVSF